MEAQPEILQIPDPKQARRAASLCSFAAVAATVIAYGLSLASRFFLRNVSLSEAASADWNLLISTGLNDLIAMPLAWLIFLRRLPKDEALAGNAPDRTPLRFRTVFFLLPCAYAVLFAGSAAGKLLGALIGGFNDILAGVVTEVHPLVTLLCASIIAPIAEELFFRKALIDRLSGFHPMDAILLSALLFGLIHGNVTQFLYAFPIGVLFGIIYWRTKNIRYTIVLHVIVNTLGGVVPILVQQLQTAAEQGNAAIGILRTAVAGLYGMTVFGLLIAGIVLLIRKRRFFLPVDSPLPHVRKPFYLNVGWFVACTVFAALAVYIEWLA